jgi:alpha-L-fucosidase
VSGDWFDGARFGMFVHWNHVSVHGRELSWPLVGGIGVLPAGQRVGIEEYYRDALSFRPAPGAPGEWASLAKAAGMRYGVLTARHHDGFSMFHTRQSDFSIEHAAYGGDIVAEYVDAFRSAGLRVGLYYSLSDWHHPDYPAFTEADKPYSLIAYRRPPARAWERYLAFLFGQIRELLTNYGTIDLIWFDGGWERQAHEWRAKELEELIRSLQPDILINDRLPSVGDYETPEQFVPPHPPPGRWETCMTMNRSWGYVPSDMRYKSSRELVHTLCEVASRGGNLLLNVSPRADGSLPPEQVERLHDISSWMDANRACIHDTTPGLEPWQVYGTSTRSGERLFVQLLMRPYDSVTIRGVPIKRVRSVRHLSTGAELEFSRRAAVLDQLLNVDPTGELRIQVPEKLIDPLATVLELVIG